MRHPQMTVAGAAPGFNRSTPFAQTCNPCVAMSLSPVIERRSTNGPTHPGEEICHIVTEDDPDRALCGKDVTGWPWNPPWPVCVVCEDLAGSPLRPPV